MNKYRICPNRKIVMKGHKKNTNLQRPVFSVEKSRDYGTGRVLLYGPHCTFFRNRSQG